MMTNKEIETIYRELEAHVVGKRLMPAFQALHTLLEIHPNLPLGGLGDLADRCRTLETTYQYMLQYALSGTKDKEQNRIYNQLRIDILELADWVREGIFTNYSQTFLYSYKRGKMNTTFPAIEDIKTRLSAESISILRNNLNENREALRQREEFSNQIFDLLWLNDKLTDQQCHEITDLCADEELYWADQCLMVSALTLSLMRIFDERKFMVLIDTYELSASEQVKQRAITGFVICAYIHNLRLPLYNNLKERSIAWTERSEVSSNIQNIFLQVIRSKETEKLTKQINEVILPEMAKLTPLIKEKLKIDEWIKSGKPTLDANPEWQNIIDKNGGITDKIQQFSEMQMEGSDVFLGTFKEMKSFSFFNDTANWFRPFDIHSQTPSFFTNELSNSLFHNVLSSPIFCNSDKYSMMISLAHIPDNQKEMLTQSFTEEAEQIKAMGADMNRIGGEIKRENISNQYIQDLYRFLKLGRHTVDFIDIFNWKLYFHKTYYVESLPDKAQTLRTVGELYFKKEFTEEARLVFETLLEKEPNNTELLQKCGFCCQKLGEYEAALSYFEKSDTIKTGNIWTIKKIAACHKLLGHTEEALHYFREAERLDPDDLNTQLNIGHALLGMERYEEALSTFFKIEYLSESDQKVWRPIAWCALSIGKLPQAEKYASKIAEGERDQHDWLNLGHIEFALGKIQEAVQCYAQCIKKLAGDTKRFTEMMEEDKHLLQNMKVDEGLLPLMIDQAYISAKD